MVNERLSAWCDGELADDEIDQLIAELSRSETLRQASELDWLIGDVIRGEAPLSSDFTSRVMATVACEPVVLAPAAAQVVREKRQARRPVVVWMQAAAALSGVLVAGWAVFSMWSSSIERTQTAATAPQSVVAASVIPASAGIQASDRAYLMAHQASSVGAPMADVAHYIRTVSDEQQGSAK